MYAFAYNLGPQPDPNKIVTELTDRVVEARRVYEAVENHVPQKPLVERQQAYDALEAAKDKLRIALKKY